MEVRGFDRCRLVGLELPDGWLPKPAFGAVGRGVTVGVIVKPALGLSPPEVADVARAAIAGGATFVKDDDQLGDPPWCPLEARVRAVAGVLEADVVYCANVTGPTATLLERARRAVELATGVMVNAFAQGLDAVLTLRSAALGVPVFAHRVGSGPWARNDRYGAATSVLARLTRLCGADYVIVGAFGGKLFDDDQGVDANLEAVRGPCGSARPAVAVVGSGVGSAAYGHPGGLTAGVAATVEALAR